MALFLPPSARRQRRCAPLDFAREGQRGPPHLVERPSSFDAHVHVHAARARRFRPADEREVGERGLDDLRDLADLRPRHAGHRIEIHAQLVRVVEILGSYGVRMKFEAGEVRHPREGCGIARNDLFRRASRWKPQRDDVDPRRSRAGRAFLVEELSVDAVRVSDENVGPSTGAAKRAFRDGEVIAHEIDLRVSSLREQDLARIRDRNLASRNRQPFVIRPGRHVVSIIVGCALHPAPCTPVPPAPCPLPATIRVVELAGWLRSSRRILIFTGAGVSTASGIPDFRGPGGVWTRRRPVYYDEFLASEEARIEYWDYKLETWDIYQRAQPNALHDAVVALERAGKIVAVVTQNVDGLHQKAGLPPELVIEVHGTAHEVCCWSCGERAPMERALARAN